VNTGASDRETHRAVHVVHIDSCCVIGSTGSPAESIGWSPAGRYLLLKKWAPGSSGTRASASVWDMSTFEEFTPGSEILSQPWAAKAYFYAPPSLHRLSGDFWSQNRLLSADGRRMLSKSGTEVLAVQGEGCEIDAKQALAQLPGGPFAHAAWHPVDPHCLVTVGGAGSEEFPDTYTRDRDSRHGRLARIWRFRGNV
jgi:hypothetical protein